MANKESGTKKAQGGGDEQDVAENLVISFDMGVSLYFIKISRTTAVRTDKLRATQACTVAKDPHHPRMIFERQ